MKISHDKAPCFVRQIYYPDLLSRKCIHLIVFACWFPMIFLGTTLLGMMTNLNSYTTDYCTDSQAFCTKNVLFNSSGTYRIYVILQGFHQNNRMFMDAYSNHQLHGQIGTMDHCGSYYTYGSIGATQTVGGYRVNSTAHLHPCGQVMKQFNVDSVYLVDSQGGTPSLTSTSLVSSFNRDYHFLRLDQYQLSQWVDVQSQRFVNYFTVPVTGVKYELIGVVDIQAGNYKVVMQNNFLTQGVFTKQLLITEVGGLGVANNIMGFSLFSYGILLLFLHIYLCYRWRK